MQGTMWVPSFTWRASCAFCYREMDAFVSAIWMARQKASLSWDASSSKSLNCFFRSKWKRRWQKTLRPLALLLLAASAKRLVARNTKSSIFWLVHRCFWVDQDDPPRFVALTADQRLVWASVTAEDVAEDFASPQLQRLCSVGPFQVKRKASSHIKGMVFFISIVVAVDYCSFTNSELPWSCMIFYCRFL